MQDNDEEEAHVKSARRVEVGWGEGGYICFVRKGKMQGEEMGNDNPKEYCSKQKGEKRARIKDKENYDG